MKRLSVVVPTYNEAEIGSWLEDAAAVLAPLDAEVLLVDDSNEATHQQMRALTSARRAFELRVLRGTGRGKGDAVRLGILEAAGRIVVILDADIDPEKLALIPQFIETIERDGFDVVIAERRSRWEYRNAFRFVLSIGLFVAQRALIFHSTRFFDTQCGFKAFRRDAARMLAERQTVRGGMFDIEYLYVATKQGLRIAQIPIAPMREVRPSKLRVLRCLVTDPVDLLRVKWNGLRGRYR